MCRLMQLHLPGGALLGEKFQPPKLSPQSELHRQAAARWAVPIISSLLADKSSVGPDLKVTSASFCQRHSVAVDGTKPIIYS